MKRFLFTLVLSCFLIFSFSIHAFADDFSIGQVIVDGVVYTQEQIDSFADAIKGYTTYALGFVTNFTHEQIDPLLDYISNSNLVLMLNSDENGSYSVDKKTYDDLNRLLSEGGFNGRVYIGALGSLSEHPDYSSAVGSIGGVLMTSGSSYVYYEPSFFDATNMRLTMRATVNSVGALTSITSNARLVSFKAVSSYLSVCTNPTNSYLTYFAPSNSNTLAGNSLSPQAFTPMSPTQITNINYEQWYDNKYVPNLPTAEVYNYYNTIVAPEPVEPETTTEYTPQQIYSDINDNLTNVVENGFQNIGFDLKNMQFITAVFHVLPFNIQNLILLTLTLIMISVVIGLGSFVVNKTLHHNETMNRLHTPFKWSQNIRRR